MRYELFYKLIARYVPEGTCLPAWAIALRWVVMPLDTLFWHMEKHRGYQFERDLWTIEGVRYTGAAMRDLAQSTGETYRIKRDGEVVTLERVHNS